MSFERTAGKTGQDSLKNRSTTVFRGTRKRRSVSFKHPYKIYKKEENNLTSTTKRRINYVIKGEDYVMEPQPY